MAKQKKEKLLSFTIDENTPGVTFALAHLSVVFAACGDQELAAKALNMVEKIKIKMGYDEEDTASSGTTSSPTGTN